MVLVEDREDKDVDVATTLFWGVKKTSGESDVDVTVEESMLAELATGVLEADEELVSTESEEDVTVDGSTDAVLVTVDSKTEEVLRSVIVDAGSDVTVIVANSHTIKVVVSNGSLVVLLTVLVREAAMLVKVWTDGSAVYVRYSVVVLRATVDVLRLDVSWLVQVVFMKGPY